MMEMVQRSIGVQVNLCNCHCLLGQSISSLPPRSPRTTTRSRHHFIFNKALSVDNSHSHPSELPSSSFRLKGSHEGSWDCASGGGHSNFYSSVSSATSHSHCHRGAGDRGDYCGGTSYTHGSGQTVSSVNNSTSSRTARSSLSEMDSVSEADENNKLLELECSPASTSTMEQEDSSDNMLGDQDKSSEVSRLLPSNNSNCASASGSNLNLAENNQNQTCSPNPLKPDLSLHQTAADILNKRDAHPHHFKRKYNFRSDSVFSDVMPLPTESPPRETPKTSDNREKSGSLSSLKGQSSNSSKWASLRKKLGRLNSSSSEKHQHKALEHQAQLQHQLQQHQHQHQHPQQHHPKTAKSSLEEKRSLLQRAKTLAILPVNRAGKDEIVKKPKEKETPKQPPELFNVGGEMNMIPLELLIDINDLNLQQ